MSDASSHEAPGTIDRQAAKLRTSCDACNEAKVRCSQAKPQCAKCEKKGIACIYGLSRRSHKTAPRVGALQMSAPSAMTSSMSLFSALGTDCNQNGSFENVGSSDDPSSYSPSVSQAILDSFRDNIEPITVFAPSDFDSYFQSSGLSGLIETPRLLNLDHHDAVITPTMGHEAMEGRASFHSESIEGNTHNEILANSQALDQPVNTETHTCDCTLRIMRQMLAATPTFQDKTASFDVLLSQLRHSTRLCEDSIECACTSGDELNIMVISILVGRIIQGFEATLSIKSVPPIHQNADESLGDLRVTSTAPPRLSWGVLQIEHDDEDDLKRHLWLMQFRKLERLLSQFSASVGRLKSARGSSSSAHVMACECTHMWLEQKSRAVKEKYLAQGMVGPATDIDSKLT